MQRCGRSVRQCSLACDTQQQHSNMYLAALACCLLGEPDPCGEWSQQTAKCTSATTESKCFFTLNPPRAWRKGHTIHERLLLLLSWCRRISLHTCVGLIKPQPQPRTWRCHFGLQYTPTPTPQNAISCQPHQLTTGLSSGTESDSPNHVRVLLSSTP